MKKTHFLLWTFLLHTFHFTKATQSIEQRAIEQIDTCIASIDSILPEKETQKTLSFEDLGDDAIQVIFDFSNLEDSVKCAYTCQIFHKILSKPSKNSLALTAIEGHALNELLQLQKSYPDSYGAKLNEVGRRIAKLSNHLSEIEFSTEVFQKIDLNGGNDILLRPVSRWLFRYNRSFCISCLDVHTKDFYKKSIGSHVYEQVKHVPWQIEQFQEGFLSAVVSKDQKKKDALLIDLINDEHDAGLDLFLYVLDTHPSDVLKMGKYSFLHSSVHSYFSKLLKDEKRTLVLFGILAQKYPSAASIPETDKDGLDYFFLNYKREVEDMVYTMNQSALGEIVYFIQDRGIDAEFLDTHIDEKRSEANIVSLNEVFEYIKANRHAGDSGKFIHLGEYEAEIQAHFNTRWIVENWTAQNDEKKSKNRKCLDKLNNIKANLPQYASLSTITLAATAFLVSIKIK
ncbi:MAG: hypothetical protein AAF380_01815 [Bacteroidota bacterium]